MTFYCSNTAFPKAVQLKRNVEIVSMFEQLGNSTLKYLSEAQDEHELFSITSDLLSAQNITHFLIKNSKRNEGIPLQLMQRFSDRTTEIIKELCLTKRDPISCISENSYIPCDIFRFKDSFADDKLAMELFRQFNIEGVNPLYLFSIHMPDADGDIICLGSTKEIFLKEAELFSLQGLLLYVSVLRSKFINADEASKKIEMLTKREREVLFLMAQGYTDREIGSALTISLVTVGFHVKNAKKKLGAKNKCHAVYLSGVSEKNAHPHLSHEIDADYLQHPDLPQV